MDNQKVRAHLRKGELAVTLLESLGYRYEQEAGTPTFWVAPAKTELEQFKEQVQELLTPPQKRKSPVRDGAHFHVTSLPAGHFLHAYMYRRMVFTVVSSEWIVEGSEKSTRLKGFTGWAVHFEAPVGGGRQGLWLPLSCIKVTSNADF